jgi:hypothetical protein
MRTHLQLIGLLLLVASCKTESPKEATVVGRPGSQVFKMPQGFFMSETLELKKGRFRYWFSSDMVVRGGPKYPIEGSCVWQGDGLILSSGKTFKARQINGDLTLFWPQAVEYWDRQQLISGHILLPVESIGSGAPALNIFFTKEQLDTSAAKAGHLTQ